MVVVVSAAHADSLTGGAMAACRPRLVRSGRDTNCGEYRSYWKLMGVPATKAMATSVQSEPETLSTTAQPWNKPSSSSPRTRR